MCGRCGWAAPGASLAFTGVALGVIVEYRGIRAQRLLVQAMVWAARSAIAIQVTGAGRAPVDVQRHDSE